MIKLKGFLPLYKYLPFRYVLTFKLETLITKSKKNQKIILQSDENCPVRKSLAILGGKWTLLILFQLNERVLRYGELKRTIPGISEKVLIQELNFLVEHKFISKKSFPEIPPRVEYRLTKLGLNTLPIVDKLAEFGLENLN